MSTLRHKRWLEKRCGWLGLEEAKRAWDYMQYRFPERLHVYGQTEYKRTCAWDSWKVLGFDINQSILYKQLIGDCLHGDVLVLGEQIKSIKEVEVGDRVYDGAGRWTTVISKQAKSVAGPMWELDCYGTIPTKVTSDHKMLVMRPVEHHGRPVTAAALQQAETQGSWRRLDAEQVRAKLEEMRPRWMRADQIQPGDYLLTPERIEQLPLPEDFPIELDEDGLWLVGYFLANGYASKSSIEITAHENKQTLLDWIGIILHDNGFKCSIKKVNGKRAVRLRVHSKDLAARFRREFYAEDKTKNFPGWAIGQMPVIDGLFAGDACQLPNGQRLVSTSRSLIHGAELTLITNGIRASAGVCSTKGTRYPNAKPQYYLIAADQNEDSIRKDWSKFRHAGYYARKVRKVMPIEGWEVVYDIGVEADVHSFIGNGVIHSNCVSFGAANAVAAVAAHEIVRLGELEKFHVPFPPYLYGISRVMPEGGNGRLGNSDGSLGSWMADTIIKYGVLRADFEGVPKYSAQVAKSWGRSKSPWEQFIDEADDHLMRSAAPIRNGDELREALYNGYFCTIASNRGFSMQLKDEGSKSWFVGSDNWPHQMAYCAIDDAGDESVYIRNSWGSAHGKQLDGPDGGGWRHLDDEDKFLRRGQAECFAFSMFDGFPAEVEKPRNWFADPAPPLHLTREEEINEIKERLDRLETRFA